MKEQPKHKSLKVLFTVWQKLTRITAITGETRSDVIKRLVEKEIDSLELNHAQKNSQAD